MVKRTRYNFCIWLCSLNDVTKKEFIYERINFINHFLIFLTISTVKIYNETKKTLSFLFKLVWTILFLILLTHSNSWNISTSVRILFKCSLIWHKSTTIQWKSNSSFTHNNHLQHQLVNHLKFMCTSSKDMILCLLNMWFISNSWCQSDYHVNWQKVSSPFSGIVLYNFV